MSAKRDSTLNELKRKLAEARAERDEARAQQTATGDVLRAISRSTFDLQSVLDALSETAARLCEAELAFMTRRDGSVYRFVTAVGSTPKTKSDAIRLKETALDRQTFAAGRGSITGRVLAEGRTVQIPDLTADPEYTVGELESIGKIRTLLSVPLMRDEEVIGTMSFGRQRVEPFTERQIALVNTFAAQAVIAIENARLLNETRERTAELQQSLEYQTATSDVLQVISRSTFDLHPVLQMLVETAARLCETDMAFLLRREGDTYRSGAAVGFSEEYKEYLATHPLPITRGSTTGRVALEKRIIHIPDCMADPEYTHTQSVELAGQRTSLGVPLLREGEVIGVIVLARRRVEPFTEKQIELVSTFADQAVIAMENARLLGDLRDRTDDLQQSLEYQTAISDVLKVISGSGFELAPVFQTVVSTAVRLCRADQATIYRLVDGEYRWAADHSLAPDYERIERNVRIRPGTGTLVGRVASICDTVQILDAWTDPLYEVKDDARVGGVHTMLGVPLLRDGLPIGVIGLARRRIENYNEREIALVRTFADQAVIAIENARLITETREALEQQTATAEVLGVINSSPGDLAPVFEAMLTKALHLCEATFGILWNYDGKEYHATAFRNVPQAYMDFLRDPPPADPKTPLGRIASGEPFAHIHDMAADGLFEDGSALLKQAVDRGGFRTIVGVPLRKDGKLLGAITIYRKEVRPFANKQIALLQNFAAQAVIAIENARLLGETRDALEQQTATAEVLQVINASPGDLTPVFDAMLEKATRLCGAHFGVFFTHDGEQFRMVAQRGVLPEMAGRQGNPFRPLPGLALDRIARGEGVVQIADVRGDPGYQSGSPQHETFVELGGARTTIWVALRRGDVLLGLVAIYRREVRPFSDKQIALLQNFAAQAVIAMENARLLTETREALEQQTATAEVLGVINASPGDLAPVFNAMLEKALRLCEATHGQVWSLHGGEMHAVAVQGDPKFSAWIHRQGPIRPFRGSAADRIVQGEDFVHLTDRREEETYRCDPVFRELVDTSGVRSSLSVPLRKDDQLLGMVNVYRQEVRPFTDRQIALLQNFAAQAVIAIENARLLTETKEALEQQTATAEVLGVINASPGNLAPVFDAMLERALRLCDARTGHLLRYADGTFSRVASLGIPEDFDKLLPLNQPLPHVITRDSVPYRTLVTLEPINVADLKEDASYRAGAPAETAAVDEGGVRSVLFVPLLKDGEVVGNFVMHRLEVRPFSDKQIALLQNFAAQAVIAMENARLITETREALEQQTAAAEVLGVINASPGDLVPVFDAMLEKAMQLCGASFGVLAVIEDGSLAFRSQRNIPQSFFEFVQRPVAVNRDTFVGRAVLDRAVIQASDILTEEPYRRRVPLAVAAAEAGVRTMVFVPLVKDDGAIGAFTIYRTEVRSFTDKEIVLLRNFAAQAVIAMENARLLTETREALEQQTATAEVLGVINSSPGDLTPVFDAILEKAMRLCEADIGSLGTWDNDDRLRWVAAKGMPDQFGDYLRTGEVSIGPREGFRRIASRQGYIQFPDISTSDFYLQEQPYTRALVELGEARTTLSIPLAKDNVVLGVLAFYRKEVRPFSDKQIALLQNFAAQAVVAMENARLLDEIRQRQAELRVTFDNMADGVAMFDQGLRLAAWNRNFQELLQLPDALLTERPAFDTYIRYLTERGEFGQNDPETEIARLRSRLGDHYSFERTRPDGTVVEVRHNPMPDGGFVLIYSDITERKRSEEEVRAARDAAEAAYADLKAAQSNLVQAQKMAALGQLTAGIAHEIKNPLNFVNNFASLSVELLDELKDVAEPVMGALSDDKRAELDETMVMLTGNLEKIAEHGKRADNIVKSMLEHSRGVSGERREVDLNGVIEEALNLAYHGARAQDQSFNITLERDYAQSLRPVDLAPQEMTRVFLNLFGNGFYAANKRARDNGGGTYRPTLTVTTSDAGDAIEVRVRDNGTGIPAEVKDKLFQPFFTTKPTGEGTGLGLSISYDIVTQQHGGTITVESEPGAYTEFTIRLPRR